MRLRNADAKAKYEYELVVLHDECKPNVAVQVATRMAALIDRILKSEHTRVPVGEGSPDALVGVMNTRAPLAALATGKPLYLKAYLGKASAIPDTTDALDVLEILRDADVPMAPIHDEYGHFEGIVTPADILEASAGVFRSDIAEEKQPAVLRDDGSWLLAGWMPADEMAEQIGIVLPARRDYQTVAGFVLAQLQRLPSAGEHVEVSGWRFEVVDLDGRRIDKVLASRVPVTRRQI